MAVVGIGQWLGTAWAGLKTIASWITSNPWKTVAITLTWRLIREIRKKRYEAGRMGGWSELLYEIFSPVGDIITDTIVFGAEATAWSTIFYNAYVKKPIADAVREVGAVIDRESLDLLTNPRAWGVH